MPRYWKWIIAAMLIVAPAARTSGAVVMMVGRCAPTIAIDVAGERLTGYLIGGERQLMCTVSLVNVFCMDWEIGWYEMSDGRTLRLACFDPPTDV